MALRLKGELMVRRATHADCNSIWAINRGVHGELDAFLYTFHQRVASKNFFPYVAELDGTIIGYSCGEVINDGKVIVMGQARVSEKYQNQEVINKVQNVLISAAISNFPNLRKMLWSSANRLVSNRAMGKHPYIEMVDSKHSVLFDAPSAKLKSICNSKLFIELEERYRPNAVHAVPKQEALQLLTREIRFLDFAPEYLVISWQPYGWHKSTLAEQLQTTNLHVSKCEESGKIVAFSHNTIGPLDRGLGCTASFYCRSGIIYKDLVLSHLLYHIKELAEMQNHENIVFCMIFPREIEKQSVHGFLNINGLQSVDTDSFFFAADIAALNAPKSSL